MTHDDRLAIRNAVPDDAERIADIAERAWQPVWREFRRQLGDELFDQLHPDAVQRKRDDVVWHATEHPELFFVAEFDGQVVGFVGVHSHTGRDGVVGEIGNNAVDPSFQGRGIATKLYEHALAFLRREGQKYVVLTTGLDQAHAPARRAYEKVGLRQACPTVNYVCEL